MSEQLFLDFSLNFNLRQTRRNVPTIIYALFTFQGRRCKVNIGAKVYPAQWNKRRQIATVSNGQTRLDNRNNEIVNKRIRAVLAAFEEKKSYLCENLERMDFLLEELRQAINPNLKTRHAAMKENNELSATLILSRMAESNIASESSKKIYLGYVSAFKEYLEAKGISDRLSAINRDVLEDYQQYLQERRPAAVKTLLNKVKGIVTLINHANKDKSVRSNINTNGITYQEDNRSREQRKSKQVTLTESQLLAIYNYTDLNAKERETRDLFICQCLLGQRISDLPKILKGDYRITKLGDGNEVISFMAQKTSQEATLYLFPVVKEILGRYRQTGFEHIDLLAEDEKVIARNEVKLNKTIKEVCRKAGLDNDIDYVEQIGSKIITRRKKLFELIHTHTARHTFITLMCRYGVPKEDVIVATAHTDIKMIDEVYLHETVNDKGTRYVNSMKRIKGSAFFKVEGADNTADTVVDKERTARQPVSTAGNITFETLLDTQFLASRINEASDMAERMGYVKDGKLYDYNGEINGIVKEVEAFMQSPAPGFEVACKYVERLSVGNLSNLRDELKLLIVRCMRIEANAETIMQIIDKAFRMGILDNDSLNDMKEIVSAILKAKEKEIEK
ncbi:tyrosine-type recombinase/integrase [Bacteroides uniformis]|uniref:Tyrosine-type recombinase/integrase n=1 Tax=Bacteroides uniformis TaxID=820 RepID=A0A7J5H4J1_BACUN|nr:tyrosine-type recombinase/integrase [Bacteroides uniformis]KAB4184856.1 tyrosine-type recombinase/integrase [Bacteroides uniformis]